MGNILYDNLSLIKVLDKTLKEITVKDGIMAIAPNAFEDCLVEKVNLPKGLLYIEEKAFYNCKNLKEINFPDTIQIINDFAFTGTKLNTLILPEQLYEIGSFAFASINLTLDNLTIPESVKTIKKYAFDNISVKNLYISKLYDFDCSLFKSIENYHLKENNIDKCISKNGDIYTDDLKILIKKGNNNNNILPVETLFYHCFWNSNFNRLIIPDSVEVISKEVFENVTIKKLTISKNLKHANKFFENVYIENIDLNNNEYFIIEDNVIFDKKSKKFLFYYLPSKKEEEYVIPDTVTTITKDAFNTCPNLKKLIIRNSLYEGYKFNNPNKIPAILKMFECFKNTSIKEVEIFTPISFSLKNIVENTKIEKLFLPSFSSFIYENNKEIKRDFTIYTPNIDELKNGYTFKGKIRFIQSDTVLDSCLHQGKTFKEINQIMKIKKNIKQ